MLDIRGDFVVAFLHTNLILRARCPHASFTASAVKLASQHGRTDSLAFSRQCNYSRWRQIKARLMECRLVIVANRCFPFHPSPAKWQRVHQSADISARQLPEFTVRGTMTLFWCFLVCTVLAVVTMGNGDTLPIVSAFQRS